MNLTLHLNVYNHIVTNGEKQSDKYVLGELSAWHDFDGYTCFLGYKELTMSLYFHGKFSYDYEKETTREEFIAVIEKMQSEL
jgi:hypothetical protein